jgi:L-lactate dehydrogenase (cytochrome)
MPFKIGPRQFIDRVSPALVVDGGAGQEQPQMANFDMAGCGDRTKPYKANWDTLAQLRDMWPGKLVVKVCWTRRDAPMLRDAGVRRIQVSVTDPA